MGGCLSQTKQPLTGGNYYSCDIMAHIKICWYIPFGRPSRDGPASERVVTIPLPDVISYVQRH